VGGWLNGGDPRHLIRGIYSVTLTNAAGCSATDAINVAYASPSSVDLGLDQSICQGQSLLLDATLPGATYLWSTGATTGQISVSTPGLYSVTVFQGACSVSDAITISVLPVPTVDLGNDTTLCAGASLNLDASYPSAGYVWSTGSTASSITVSAAGTYSVDVDLNGCIASDDIVVNVLSPGSIDLGADTSFCQGGSLLLDATLAGATYLWSTGATSSSISVTTSGTYSVQADVSGCAATDAIDVVVLPVPTADLGNDTTICAGATLILDASYPGAQYEWSTGSTTSSITVSTAGTYSVDVGLGICMASDDIVVNVLSPGAIALGADTSFCQGGTLVLDASLPGATYLWSTGATTSSISVTTSGTYSVQADVSGCSASDAIDVTVLPMPVVDLGNDTTLCSGASHTLDASYPGATYLWSTGSTASSILVSTAGTYSVDVDLGGCVATDAIDVDVLSAVSFDLGNDTLAVSWSNVDARCDPARRELPLAGWINGEHLRGERARLLFRGSDRERLQRHRCDHDRGLGRALGGPWQ
jgi:hypothetical protein